MFEHNNYSTASSVAAVDCSPTEESSSFSPLEESSQSVDTLIYFEPEEDLSSTPSTSKKRKSVGERDDPLAKKMCELVTQFTKFTESRQSEVNSSAPFFKMSEQKFQVIPEQHLDQIKLNILNYVFKYATRVANNESVDDLALS